MSFSTLLLLIIAFSLCSFFFSSSSAFKKIKSATSKPSALPKHYGQYSLVWTLFPAFLLLIVFTIMGPIYVDNFFKQQIALTEASYDKAKIELVLAMIKNISNGSISNDEPKILKLAEEYKNYLSKIYLFRTLSVLLLSSILGIIISSNINILKNSRVRVETFYRILFFISAVIAIFTTVGIIASLLYESLRFFALYSFFDFLFGLHWAPNIAIRSDQVAAQGSFGMLPVLLGTILVALIAMLVALPIGLFSAIYLAEFASKRVRDIIKPTLEVLAGIPTVVYGYFAALTAAPFIRKIGMTLGLDVSSESALAAGAVMGIMIIPFISSLSDDIINSVPQSLRDGSLGLGATKAETTIKVVLPAAFPGLVGAFLLAVSRAIGETMIVVMAAGLSANLTINPLETVTTVTVQIVSLLTGDTEFDDIKTLSAFGLGLALFAFTLILNVIALVVSRRLSEQYD
tara:strand:+ start:500 stop:1876 length:1377 start_codon:yes stop_codon:yes gene_type:complete